MAAGNDYPAEIVDANGNVTEGATIRFLDSADQPFGTEAAYVAVISDVSGMDSDGTARQAINDILTALQDAGLMAGPS